MVHQLFIGIFVRFKSESIDETTEVVFDQQVHLAIFSHKVKVIILLPNEVETAISLILKIVKSDQKTLFLNLFNSNEDVMTLTYFHTLRVNNVLVCKIFLVQTELQFL